MILDTATGILVRDGFDGLTMNGLARELDYSPGALYRYFPSRDALLAEIQTIVFRDALGFYSKFADRIGHFVDSNVEDAETADLFRLYMVSWMFRRFAADHPRQFAFLSRMLADPRQMVADDEAGVAVAAGESVLSTIGQVFEKVADRGWLDSGDGNARAVIFWSAFQGILQLQKVSRFYPELLDMQKLLSESAAAHLTGWGADPEKIAACRNFEEIWGKE